MMRSRILLTIVFMMTALTTMAQGVMDVHCHTIPPAYIDALKQHDALLDEGFPLPKWDVSEQIKWMNDAGVETAVLTLVAPQPYFGNTKESAKIIRKINEATARLKKEHPGRFLFCAALPLPDVKAAIAEAEYALDVLHADGIKLATNVAGQYLGAPELDTLMAVLNSRKAVVILHPHKPEPVNEQVMTQTPLAMQEYLSETTRAVANMITRNVPARYPEMRIVIPHCGAYLPLALPRMKALAPVMQQNMLVGRIDWDKNLASFYYDLAGAHSPETIRLLLTITTPDRLLYGSDHPYAASPVLTASLNRMKKYLSEAPDLAPFSTMILRQNARWLFGLQQEKPSAVTEKGKVMVRIADVEVKPEYISAYLEAAHEVQRASIENEPGVICLFPNQMKEDSTQFRIVEIYASEEAYQHHIQTSHFLAYKQKAQPMVKRLKLNDLSPLDIARMPELFKRMK